MDCSTVSLPALVPASHPTSRWVAVNSIAEQSQASVPDARGAAGGPLSPRPQSERLRGAVVTTASTAAEVTQRARPSGLIITVGCRPGIEASLGLAGAPRACQAQHGPPLAAW